jgi:hypothetical protein
MQDEQVERALNAGLTQPQFCEITKYKVSQ